MVYRLIQTVVSVALRAFYRVEVVRRVDDLTGPVMFVGNHPNSLIDPAMIFMITNRRVTFLAKEPLFRVPVFGWLLRALGALPVFRKQDHPGLMEKNEGTLEAAARALSHHHAVTIFPEGRSHSDPQLSEVKTGCARIALKVASTGQSFRIIPVGLTYAQKHRVRSKVLVEVADPLLVEAIPVPLTADAEREWVRELTERVEQGLRAVTLNLETWEDLDLIETANFLFALRTGAHEEDAERLRLFAKGASLARAADPEHFDALKEDILSFRARLQMFHADGQTLAAGFERKALAGLVARSVGAMLFGFPLFALGAVLFVIPFLVLKALALAVPVAEDRVATSKLFAGLLILPLWWVALSVGGWAIGGLIGFTAVLTCAVPLALFTRYFFERRRAAYDDIAAFMKLANRARLREHLLKEGERLQDEIARLVMALSPRLGIPTEEEV